MKTEELNQIHTFLRAQVLTNPVRNSDQGVEFRIRTAEGQELHCRNSDRLISGSIAGSQNIRVGKFLAAIQGTLTGNTLTIATIKTV